MVYTIKEDIYGAVQDEVEKLRKKYPNSNVKVEVVHRYIQKDDDKDVAYLQIAVTGVAVIQGYQLIAHLHHTDNGNIIEMYVNAPLKAYQDWYDLPPNCDHCGVNRRRVHTFVVRDIKTNELYQIGDSCLDKYTGGNSVAAAKAIEKFLGLFSKEKLEALHHRHPAPVYYTKDLLACAIKTKTIYRPGLFETLTAEQLKYYQGLVDWVNSLDSTKIENHNRQVLIGTSYIRGEHIQGVLKLKEDYDYYLDTPNRVARQKAKEQAQREKILINHSNNVREWRGKIEQFKSKYQADIKMYEIYGVGLLSQASQSPQSSQASQPTNQAKSEHVGKVGDKISVLVSNVVLMSKKPSDFDNSDYGSFRFIATDGNVFYASMGMSKAEKYGLPQVEKEGVDLSAELTGTVKSHYTGRNGGKATTINRCTLKNVKTNTKKPTDSANNSINDNNSSTNNTERNSCMTGLLVSKNIPLLYAWLNSVEDFDRYRQLKDIQNEQDTKSQNVYARGDKVEVGVVSVRYNYRDYIIRGTDNNLYSVRPQYFELDEQLHTIVPDSLEVMVANGYVLTGTAAGRSTYNGATVTYVNYAKCEYMGTLS